MLKINQRSEKFIRQLIQDLAGADLTRHHDRIGATLEFSFVRFTKHPVMRLGAIYRIRQSGSVSYDLAVFADGVVLCDYINPFSLAIFHAWLKDIITDFFPGWTRSSPSLHFSRSKLKLNVTTN